MKHEGPLLESLTHRLQGCPAAFLEEPQIGDTGTVSVPAVVADLVRTLDDDVLLRPDVKAFKATEAKERNRLRLILVACWLFHDDWFQQKKLGNAVLPLLVHDLNHLATLVEADQFVTDPDRREELTRYALSRLHLRPRGETEAQAQDRLSTLDSVERASVVQKAKVAEERARKIREEMERRRQAELAAAKAPRE